MALNDSNNDFVQLATVTFVYTLQHQTFSFQGVCNGQSRKRPTDRGGKIYLALFVVLCSKALFNINIIQVMGVTLKPDIEVSNTG